MKKIIFLFCVLSASCSNKDGELSGKLDVSITSNRCPVSYTIYNVSGDPAMVVVSGSVSCEGEGKTSKHILGASVYLIQATHEGKTIKQAFTPNKSPYLVGLSF